MKTLMKTLAAFLLVALVSNVTMAQVDDGSAITDGTTVVDGTTCDGTGEPANLHDGSGALLKGQMGANELRGSGIGSGVMSQLNENGGEFRDAFQASLTDEQLAIIENLELTREEKREALQTTFTDEQQEMYNVHMTEVADRQAARGTSVLSESQAANAIKNGWKKGQK